MRARIDILGFKLFHQQVGYKGTNRGTHSCAMDLFIILTLVKEMIISSGRIPAVFKICKGSCRFSNVFFFTPIFTTFVSVYDPTFVGNRILVLWSIRRPLMVWPPLKCTCSPYFLQVFLILSLSPCWYGTTMCKFLLLDLFWPVWLLLFLFVLFVGFWLFSFTLLMAHVGYLHFLRALHKWSSSFCNSCGLEHTVLALCYRVPATLYFAVRFKEHQKSPSLIHDHCNISGHNVTINNFTIIGREDQNFTRAIKEALFIRVNDPSLNRNIGKYHLPHIWD